MQEKVMLYFAQIAKAKTLREVDDITETAAWDDGISHKDYCAVYDAGILRYRQIVDALA